jgi:hypothetical protein
MKNKEVLYYFEEYQKEKVLSELQNKLRRYVQELKRKEIEEGSSAKRKNSQKRIYSQQSIPKSK